MMLVCSHFTRSEITSKLLCQDSSMPLSVRYKSNRTLPKNQNFRWLSVSADGTFMLTDYAKPNVVYLYKVEDSTAHSCTVTCEAERMYIAVWSPRGHIICIGSKGNITVIKIAGLVTFSNANSDFTTSCLSERIISTSVSEKALELGHASVSLHSFAAILVTCLSTGIYQSTDEGVTWRHIVPMPHVAQSPRFRFAFRMSTQNQTEKLLTVESDGDNNFLRTATIINGNLVSIRNLTTLIPNFNSYAIDYNYPSSNILYADKQKLIIHVISVSRRQAFCQVQLTNSVHRPLHLHSTRIDGLFVLKKTGTNNTSLYVRLSSNRIYEYALVRAN